MGTTSTSVEQLYPVSRAKATAGLADEAPVPARLRPEALAEERDEARTFAGACRPRSRTAWIQAGRSDSRAALERGSRRADCRLR